MKTPYYSYDSALLRNTISTAQREAGRIPGAQIHYALKANHNPAILKIIAQAGLGADCVSAGEVCEALAAGIPAGKIVFSGVGKTDEEIELALEKGIWCFNVESLQELEVIDSIALERGVKARVALRINPDITAHTLSDIATGGAEDKFGIPIEKVREAIEALARSRALTFIGLHFHIGSQILDMGDFKALCGVVNTIVPVFEASGLHVGSINVGGGLGVDYVNPQANPIPDFKAYFTTFAEGLDLPAGVEFHCELGRSIVAQCGRLITRCIYVKEGRSKKFAIVDAGMNDFVRPAMYGAEHRIVNLSADSAAPTEKYDVVGPVCESTDCFARDCQLPMIHRADTLAILSAGAYGESMASTYNSRPLPGFEI